MNRFLTVFAALVLLISCAEDRKNSIQLIEYQGIRGQAVDAETGLGMPARIAIRDSTNNIVDSCYDHAPGLFTAEDGLFEKELPAGKYTMEVFHGIDYLSTKMNLEIRGRGNTCEDLFAAMV